jgi:hypothetical protein
VQASDQRHHGIPDPQTPIRRAHHRFHVLVDAETDERIGDGVTARVGPEVWSARVQANQHAHALGPEPLGADPFGD